HLRMADLVEGTHLATSAETGVWPTYVLGNVFILPGVPEIYRMKLVTVREILGDRGEAYVLRSVYTQGDEGAIKHWIDEVVARFPDVMVGSYPSFRDSDHSVRVTFDGGDRARVEEAARVFASLLPAVLFIRTD
ncbi:MAG: competence/damage-inducible protein A, partial [Deltaproteobacteria bacterium]